MITLSDYQSIFKFGYFFSFYCLVKTVVSQSDSFVGMLIPDKKGRWTSYRLNEDYVIQPEQVDFQDEPIDEIAFKNKADEVIYNYIKTNGFITTHQILAITNITTTVGASVALDRLIKVGLVKKCIRADILYIN